MPRGSSAGALAFMEAFREANRSREEREDRQREADLRRLGMITDVISGSIEEGADFALGMHDRIKQNERLAEQARQEKARFGLEERREQRFERESLEKRAARLVERARAGRKELREERVYEEEEKPSGELRRQLMDQQLRDQQEGARQEVARRKEEEQASALEQAAQQDLPPGFSEADREDVLKDMAVKGGPGAMKAYLARLAAQEEQRQQQAEEYRKEQQLAIQQQGMDIRAEGKPDEADVVKIMRAYQVMNGPPPKIDAIVELMAQQGGEQGEGAQAVMAQRDQYLADAEIFRAKVVQMMRLDPSKSLDEAINIAIEQTQQDRLLKAKSAPLPGQ